VTIGVKVLGVVGTAVVDVDGNVSSGIGTVDGEVSAARLTPGRATGRTVHTAINPKMRTKPATMAILGRFEESHAASLRGSLLVIRTSPASATTQIERLARAWNDSA
jgi:hypothetical protein